MLTIEQAKSLEPGIILYEYFSINADGTPRRWRVSGKPKVWITRPHEVKVPIKHGLYTNGYLTEDNIETVALSEEEVIQAKQQ